MNNRFKFRFWDKETQTMQKIPMVELRHRITLDKIFADDRVIFMQCTGLRDKNGKLIYEGDIVNDKSNHIRVVVWEQDSFKYPALKTSRYFHSPISNKLEERKVDLRGKLTFQDNVYKRDKKHFEVIGNIYENKELLEELNAI